MEHQECRRARNLLHRDRVRPDTVTIVVATAVKHLVRERESFTRCDRSRFAGPSQLTSQYRLRSLLVAFRDRPPLLLTDSLSQLLSFPPLVPSVSRLAFM